MDRQDDWGGSTTSTSTPSTQTSAPFFVKFCSYFPYNAKLCLNGHEWAKRQAAKAGLGFTALNNGFATCADAEAVQAICDRLGAEQIDALLRKWLTRLPHPFTGADRAAGYRYDLSVLQAEFSLTQVLDRPICGRVFLEQVIRDNLNVGRPDQVSLVFDRRIHRGRRQHTPGRFRTRVLTEGVTPSLHIDYKHTTIKQHHKEGRALSTQTTINDPGDVGIRTRLTHLPALREIGLSAHRRQLGVQRLSHNPIRAAEAFTAVHQPILTRDGHRIAGLRLVITARRRCCKCCWCSGCSHAGSATPTCAGCSPSSSASPPPGHRPGRSARTCADSAPTASSRGPPAAPLPGHRHRTGPRQTDHRHPHPPPRARAGPAHRPRPRPTRTQRPARRRPQLPA
ncbi:MAG: hypothetical protein V7633_1398, partial [Pseudonocardia sp.]